MAAKYRNWQEEFVDANFVDQRLKTRFFKIVTMPEPGTNDNL